MLLSAFGIMEQIWCLCLGSSQGSQQCHCCALDSNSGHLHQNWVICHWTITARYFWTKLYFPRSQVGEQTLVVLNVTDIFQPIIWKYYVSFLEISNPLFRRIWNLNNKKTCRIIFLFFKLRIWNLELSYGKFQHLVLFLLHHNHQKVSAIKNSVLTVFL